jgi:ABC-type branched-subunit amino acid transport system ATPase component
VLSHPQAQPVNAAAGQVGPVLSVRQVHMSFGGIAAVQNLSFDVMPGTVHALIGPNGAGKTTMLNCISRFYTPQQGQISLRSHGAEHNLLRRQSHQVASLGVARTFQNLELFADLSVFDNLLIARTQAMRATLAEALFRLPRQRLEERREKDYVLHLLNRVGLADLAQSTVRDLPYGTQKRVELARAMALEPVLMLLDEPAAGMNRNEIEALGQTLRQIQSDTGATLLLIEHSMPLVMSLSDTITVMHNGALLAQGTPAEIEAHPEVVAAYLGGGKSGKPH